MAWRSAREAGGRDKPTQTAVNRGSHGPKYAARSGLGLEPAGAKVVFELAKVFGQFRGPVHAYAWLVRMFEGKDFRVQGLAREINARVGGVRAAYSRIVGAVAEQGESGVRRLHANLMFPAGFEPEPQFGDEACAARNGILGDDFVVSDGLAGLGPGSLGLRFGEDLLTQLVPAQLQPLPPNPFRRAGPAVHVGHIFPFHGVGFELFDQVMARSRVRGHAKDAAGILVQAMDRQGL